MSSEIAVRESQSELAQRVEREVGARFKQLTTLLGSEQAAKRFARTLVIACEDVKLAKCSPASVVQAALGAASIGLEVGGPRSHAALVPFKTEAKLMVMVKGWLHVAKRDGGIIDAQVVLVREGELFRWTPAAELPVSHEPSHGLAEPGQVIAAYVILRLPGGERVIDVVPGYYLARVEKFALAKAGDRSTPWRGEWREEMLRKTALRKVLATHLDAVRVSAVDALDSAPVAEPAPTLSAIVEESESEPAPAPRARRNPPAQRVGTLDETPKPAPAPAPILDRIYTQLALDGLTQADADAEIAQAWPSGATDAQLEEWLARGCR